MAPSRRDALKVLGAGVIATALEPAVALSVHRHPWVKAEFFGLRDVRLGAGPFLAAQKLDERYLLELEPDRMLHNFRLNAGLKPKALVYGGWESVEPWIGIRCHGHTLGHYLTACACMFETTADPRFAARVDYIVDELALCQKNRGDGLVTAFPDNAAPLIDSLAGRPFVGVPWYTVHKIMAGLRDAHAHRGSSKALDVWLKIAGWIDEQSKDVSDAAFQKMLDREHGGMNEVFADLYQISGDERHKRLALRFSHRAILEPLAAGIDKLDGLHSNTQIPKVIGFSRIHDVTSAPEYGRAAQFFWRTVVEKRSFATGGHGDVEHFFPPDKFPEHLSSGKTMETCCTYNMLRLTRSLYVREPQVAHFDFYERALFNGILASQDPETGMNTYFQSTRPGYVRLYHRPFDAFWCCMGSGIENHARYGENIYARDAGTLYVNLFLASTLDWKERGVRVTQTTRFPDEDSTQLAFEVGKFGPRLAIRQPSWCPAMTVTVNGKRRHVARQPGTYYRPRGALRHGDIVEIRTPMALRLEALPNDPTHAALAYGPIVLAGRLGTKGLSQGSQLIINERESGKMLNDAIEVPTWNKPLTELLASTARTDERKLVFTTRGFAGDASVELIPWFRLTHERYNLYWRQTAPTTA